MTETIPSDVSTDQKVSGVEIVLESVTKRYPGQKAAAVDNVSLTVPAGEIVVFVGLFRLVRSWSSSDLRVAAKQRRCA